jgi:hypothetical protein
MEEGNQWKDTKEKPLKFSKPLPFDDSSAEEVTFENFTEFIRTG